MLNDDVKTYLFANKLLQFGIKAHSLHYDTAIILHGNQSGMSLHTYHKL